MSSAPTSMLNADDMVRDAISQTGLSQFSDDSYREPLRVLVTALNQEARLNETGKAIQRYRLTDILSTNLRMQAYFTQHPEILEEEIRAPVVIAALPRTGSTMLHRILASDPRFYAPFFYEVRFPAPADNWDFTVANDERIPKAKAEVQAMLEGSPDLAAAYPLDATAADEEIMLLENSFYSIMPSVCNYVPSYSQWTATHDNTPGYQSLKRQLQFLQWQKKRSGVGSSAQRWLLKTPHHLLYLSTLLKTFPDAVLIQTHRDPRETIPSNCSLIEALYKLGSDTVNPLAIGAEWAARWAQGMERSLAIRQAHPSTFFDVSYDKLASDFDGVMLDLYRFLNMPWTDDVKNAMEQWREANRRELRPQHHYDMATYGLTESGLQTLFAPYRAFLAQLSHTRP